jgi:HlyD family secretion protein
MRDWYTLCPSLTSMASPLADSATSFPSPPSASADARHKRRCRLSRLLSRAAIGLVIVAGVVFGWKAVTAPKGPTLQFETAKVDRGPISSKVTANGTLSALVMVSVGSQVSGRIESLRVDFGSPVKKGQIIATIEPSLLRAARAQTAANYAAAQAAVGRAEAQAINADRQFARAQALYAQGVATLADRDAAEAALAVARADVAVARSNVKQTRAARDQAELNLHYTTITSPIDGIVISRNVDVGQTVAATLQAPTLFSIAQDLTRMQVDTNIAEADVGKVREGMNVTFTVDAYPGRTFTGRVRQVRDNAQTIQNVVTYDAVVDVDNSERLLKPGMTATVVFVHEKKGDVVRVPNAALRFRPDAATLVTMANGTTPPMPSRSDERIIWIDEAGYAKPGLVRIGISDGTWTELVSGPAHPGERVVVEASAERPPSS